MILGFTQKINGKPTHFVEKILRTFLNEYAGKVEGIADFIYDSGPALNYNSVDHIFHIIEHKVKAKLHTIREDKNDRWKTGTMIDFFINVRKPNMFRFAPRVPVVRVQKITMSYEYNDLISITINSKELLPSERLQLAINDGFDNYKDFFNYFYPVIKNTENNFWKGKIIHWTDLKY